MTVISSKLSGALIIEPKVFGDDRGYFFEAFHAGRYKDHGLDGPWVQDNLSKSRKGVLRGLHIQNPGAQGKLVSVVVGEVYDVAVDIRLGSPTFGQWEAVVLNEKNKRQYFVPAGMAHGFVVTSDEAIFSYKCTDIYQPENEFTLLWNDPDLCIPWPIHDPQLSAKDVQGLRLKDLPKEKLVPFKG